jgi:hypothetical protein
VPLVSPAGLFGPLLGGCDHAPAASPDAGVTVKGSLEDVIVEGKFNLGIDTGHLRLSRAANYIISPQEIAASVLHDINQSDDPIEVTDEEIAAARKAPPTPDDARARYPKGPQTPKIPSIWKYGRKFGSWGDHYSYSSKPLAKSSLFGLRESRDADFQNIFNAAKNAVGQIALQTVHCATDPKCGKSYSPSTSDDSGCDE